MAEKAKAKQIQVEASSATGAGTLQELIEAKEIYRETDITVTQGEDSITIDSSTGSSGTVAAATNISSGVMSKDDKVKLNDLPDATSLNSALSTKVDKVAGRSLALDTELSKLAQYPAVSVMNSSIDTKVSKETGKELIPTTGLNKLDALPTAGDLSNSLDLKVDKVSGESLIDDTLITKLTQLRDNDTITADLSTKVDKVADKGLSEEDFTTSLKDKVENLRGDTITDTLLYGKVDKEVGKSLIEPAPEDGKQYARKDDAWVEVAGGTGDVEEAPVDGKQYARKDAAWEEVVASGGGEYEVLDFPLVFDGVTEPTPTEIQPSLFPDPLKSYKGELGFGANPLTSDIVEGYLGRGEYFYTVGTSTTIEEDPVTNEMTQKEVTFVKIEVNVVYDGFYEDSYLGFATAPLGTVPNYPADFSFFKKGLDSSDFMSKAPTTTGKVYGGIGASWVEVQPKITTDNDSRLSYAMRPDGTWVGAAPSSGLETLDWGKTYALKNLGWVEISGVASDYYEFRVGPNETYKTFNAAVEALKPLATLSTQYGIVPDLQITFAQDFVHSDSNSVRNFDFSNCQISVEGGVLNATRPLKFEQCKGITWRHSISNPSGSCLELHDFSEAIIGPWDDITFECSGSSAISTSGGSKFYINSGSHTTEILCDISGSFHLPGNVTYRGKLKVKNVNSSPATCNLITGEMGGNVTLQLEGFDEFSIRTASNVAAYKIENLSAYDLALSILGGSIVSIDMPLPSNVTTSQLVNTVTSAGIIFN